MYKFLKENKLTVIGSLLGAVGGFMYWKFAGCNNGTCVIKSNPIFMTAYGILLGGLLFNNFKKNK